MCKAVCNIILEANQIYAFNCHIPDDFEENYIKQFYTERAYVGHGRQGNRSSILIISDS